MEASLDEPRAGSGTRTVESWVTRSADSAWPFFVGDTLVMRRSLCNSKTATTLRSCSGRELDLGASRDLVEMRVEFSLDLVVVDPQVRLLGGP